MRLDDVDLTTEKVRTERLVLRPYRPDDVRSCLPYRDGSRGDAVLFGRLAIG